MMIRPICSMAYRPFLSFLLPSCDQALQVPVRSTNLIRQATPRDRRSRRREGYAGSRLVDTPTEVQYPAMTSPMATYVSCWAV